MCIRDREKAGGELQDKEEEVDAQDHPEHLALGVIALHRNCLLYTSDAADERSSVDLGGRRIIKNKKNNNKKKEKKIIHKTYNYITTNVHA